MDEVDVEVPGEVEVVVDAVLVVDEVVLVVDDPVVVVVEQVNVSVMQLFVSSLSAIEPGESAQTRTVSLAPEQVQT